LAHLRHAVPISKLSWTSASESSSFHRRATKWSTEALRGTSRHQFLCRRNELSAQLEMDCRKGQDGYGRRLRHQTRCDPSGSNLYRRSYRLGSVNHCGAWSRAALQPSRHWPSEISRSLRALPFDRSSRLTLLALF